MGGLGENRGEGGDGESGTGASVDLALDGGWSPGPEAALGAYQRGPGECPGAVNTR